MGQLVTKLFAPSSGSNAITKMGGWGQFKGNKGKGKGKDTWSMQMQPMQPMQAFPMQANPLCTMFQSPQQQFAPPQFPPTQSQPQTSAIQGMVQQSMGAINDMAAWGQLGQLSNKLASALYGPDVGGGPPSSSAHQNQANALTGIVEQTASLDNGAVLAEQAKAVIKELSEFSNNLKNKDNSNANQNKENSTPNSGHNASEELVTRKAFASILEDNPDFKRMRTDIHSVKDQFVRQSERIESIQMEQSNTNSKIDSMQSTLQTGQGRIQQALLKIAEGPKPGLFTQLRTIFGSSPSGDNSAAPTLPIEQESPDEVIKAKLAKLVVTHAMDDNFRSSNAMGIASDREVIAKRSWPASGQYNFADWWATIATCKSLAQWQKKILSMANWPDGTQKAEAFTEAIEECKSKIQAIDLLLNVMDRDLKIIPHDKRTD